MPVTVVNAFFEFLHQMLSEICVTGKEPEVPRSTFSGVTCLTGSRAGVRIQVFLLPTQLCHPLWTSVSHLLMVSIWSRFR